MKRTILLKTMLLLCALIAGSSSSWANADVTYDFTGSDWTVTAGTPSTLSNGTVTFSGEGTNFKMNTGYFMMGKSGAYINFPIYSEAVEKIVVTGRSGASSSTKMNVFVGDDAVSSETTGCTGTNTYNIASGYQEAGTQYTLKVTSNHNAQITKIEIFYAGGEVVNVTGIELDQTSLDLEIGGKATLTATVSPAEASDKSVSWESDDEDVATVSAAGVVTAVGVGTATITVTTTDGGFTATCAVTVNAAPVAALTFDFTDDGWGFPTDYTLTEESYTNGGYTFTVGAVETGGHKALISNKVQVALIFGKEAGASLTFPAFDFNVSRIKVYGNGSASGAVTFNIYVGDDAVSTEVTSSRVTQTFDIAADKQTAGTIYVLKLTNANNCQISKIEIFGYVTTPAVTEKGWASYVTPKALRFAEGEAFVVTNAGSGVVTLAEVKDVPNNFPVLLKGEGAKTASVLEGTPEDPINLLAISNGGEINGYVLAKPDGKPVGFYKWNGGSLTSGKVYLPASAIAGAPDFLGFEGGTTGIETPKAVNATGEFYNLAGQRVAQPTKGLYIVNGRKIVIK